MRLWLRGKWKSPRRNARGFPGSLLCCVGELVGAEGVCAVRDLSDLIAVNVAEFSFDPSLCATGEYAAYGVGVGGVKVDFDGVAAAYGEYEGAACESGATAANREQVHCADLCKQFLCLRVIHVVPFGLGAVGLVVVPRYRVRLPDASPNPNVRLAQLRVK